MNYQEEDKEDKKYKKGYGRKEFQKDVAEAVKPVVQETKTAKKKKESTHPAQRLRQDVRRRAPQIHPREKEGAVDQIGVP